MQSRRECRPNVRCSNERGTAPRDRPRGDPGREAAEEDHEHPELAHDHYHLAPLGHEHDLTHEHYGEYAEYHHSHYEPQWG